MPARPAAVPRVVGGTAALPADGPADAPTPSAPPRPDPAATAALNREAAILENVYFPGQLAAALGLDDTLSIMGVRLFLARFRRDVGTADDPIERQLVDQLALTHLLISRLQAQATGAEKLEFKKLYLQAAAQLLSEHRKAALDLQAYRKASRRQRRQRNAPRKDRAAPQGGRNDG